MMPELPPGIVDQLAKLLGKIPEGVAALRRGANSNMPFGQGFEGSNPFSGFQDSFGGVVPPNPPRPPPTPQEILQARGMAAQARPGLNRIEDAFKAMQETPAELAARQADTARTGEMQRVKSEMDELARISDPSPAQQSRLQNLLDRWDSLERGGPLAIAGGAGAAGYAMSPNQAQAADNTGGFQRAAPAGDTGGFTRQTGGFTRVAAPAPAPEEDPTYMGQLKEQARQGWQRLATPPRPGVVGGIENPLETAAGVAQLVGSPVTAGIRSFGGRGIQAVDELMYKGAEKLYGKERMEKAGVKPMSFEDAAGKAETASMLLPGVGFGGHTGQATSALQAARKAAGVIEKIVSPETVDSNARAAAALIRDTGGRAARDTATTERAIEPGWRTINAMPAQDQLNLIDYVEGRFRGAAAPADPAARDVADKLRTAFESRMTKLQALPAHAQQAFIDDYFPHFWKDPAKAQAAEITRGGVGRQGSGASLKARSIPTIADGIKMGLEPVTANPLEATMRYVTSMDRFIASEEVMQTAKDQGVLKWVRPKVMGASGHPESFKVPEGYAPLKGRGATRPGGEQAYAPEGFARVYNNFISRGVAELDPALGDAYEAARRGANAITGLELGLSGYHALTMLQEGVVNQVANAIGFARKGMPLEAGKALGKAPLAPIHLARTGKKVQDVYLGLSPGTRELQQVTDLLTKAGGRAKGVTHAPDYNFSKTGSYVTALKRGALRLQLAADAAEMRARPIVGTAKVVGRHIGRIMDTVAQPLFEKYIPLLKNGAFYENMSAWIKAHPTAGHEEQLNAARQIWDSVDNRFGEMVQDNIFMNKAIKQVGMLSLRSWSWTMGSGRELGGAVRDVARAPFKRPTGTGPQDERWTQKMDYVIALPLVYGTLAALYQGLKTGKAPESIQDLMAPRTGGTDATTGQDERLMLPGYMKDVFGFYEHPMQELTNKIGTAPKMAGQLLSNSDWRNDPIFNANDSAPQWLKQFWDYAVQNVGPISLRDIAKGAKEGSNLSTPERLLGVRPAPRYLTDPEGYEQMMKSIHGRQWQQKLKHDRRQQRLYGGEE